MPEFSDGHNHAQEPTEAQASQASSHDETWDAHWRESDMAAISAAAPVPGRTLKCLSNEEIWSLVAGRAPKRKMKHWQAHTRQCPHCVRLVIRAQREYQSEREAAIASGLIGPTRELEPPSFGVRSLGYLLLGGVAVIAVASFLFVIRAGRSTTERVARVASGASNTRVEAKPRAAPGLPHSEMRPAGPTDAKPSHPPRKVRPSAEPTPAWYTAGLKTGDFGPPKELRELAPESATMGAETPKAEAIPISPNATYVRFRRPTFRARIVGAATNWRMVIQTGDWQHLRVASVTFGKRPDGKWNVIEFDHANRERRRSVASHPGEWRCSAEVQLARGKTYEWYIEPVDGAAASAMRTADKPPPSAQFRVLDHHAYREFELARTKYAGSPLRLTAYEIHYGLIQEAQGLLAGDRSPLAKKIRKNLSSVNAN